MTSTGIFLSSVGGAKQHLKVPRKHFRHRCIVKMQQNLSFWLGAFSILKHGGENDYFYFEI